MKPTAFLRRFLAIAGSAVLTISYSHAATYYWDGNDGTAGFGTATGTWADPNAGTTSSGWSTDATGATVVNANALTPATTDSINFGNGATGLVGGNITVSGTVNSGNMTFASGSGAITLSGGTAINLAAAATITVNNATNTISTALTGAGTSFTKAGSGILVLSGANTYAGTTTINRGTLTLNSQTGSLNTSSGLTFSGTGTFNMDNVGASGDLAQSLGALTFSAGQGTVQTTRTAAFDQAITFSSLAARTAGASGNFVNTGTNSATNGFIFTAAPTAGTLIDRGLFYNGSSYATYDAGGFVRGFTAGDTNYLAAPAGATIGASVATSNVDLTTGNITAQTTVSANTINMRNFNIAMTGTSAVLSTNGILSSGSGSATIGGGTTPLLQAASSGGEMVIRVNGGSDVLTINSTLRNNTTASSVTKTGAGRLVLNAATFTGALNVNAGTLDAAFSPTYSSTNLASGATWNYLNAFGNNPAFNVPFTINGSFIKTGNGSMTFNSGATLSGSGSLSFSGQVTIIINSNNPNFTGTITDTTQAGSGFQLNNNGALGAGLFVMGSTNAISSTVGGGYVAAYNSTYQFNNNQTFGGSNNLDFGAGAVTLNSSPTLTISNTQTTFGGAIGQTGGTRSLTKVGTGTLLLSGAGSTYSGGTNINAGTLRLGASNVLLNAGAVAVGGGNFDIQTFSDTVGAVTLTSGSITGTSGVLTGSSFNVQNGTVSANLAGGSAALSKTTATSVTLSGTNTYGGGTTLTTGTLQFAKTAAMPATGVVAVGTGATLAVNAGAASGEWTNATSGNGSIGGLLAGLGGQSGGTVTYAGNVALGIDTTNATAGTMTYSGVIGNVGGSLGITKLGTGTLVLDQTNTYTGATSITAGTLSLTGSLTGGGAVSTSGSGILNQSAASVISGTTTTFTQGSSGTSILAGVNTYGGLTTISAGTLRLDAGGVIPGAIVNNSAFAINSAGAVTQGTNFGLISGSGSLTKTLGGTLTLNLANTFSGSTTVSAGTLALTNALALQNSALVTTGSPDVTISGSPTITSLTLGGLSGATGDLATIFSSGFTGTVTALTLNPTAGSVTYGGVIANTTMSLTKTGAGTQVLQGANSYTGATNINAGTLTLSGASGALASTAINLNGGTFTLDNSSGTGNLGTRVSDSATVTVNGNSALNFTHNAAAATNYSETIDTLSLASGFLTYTGSQAASGQTSNVLFNTLSRTGASNTSTVNFVGTGLGVAGGRNTITFGAGVTDATDLGPWAVVNGADFASYSTANGIVAATSSTLAANSNSSTTNFNTTAGSITFDALLNPSLKTLLVTGGTVRTTGLNGNTVSVGGISSTGANHIISGTGALQALTAGDALYVNVGTNQLTISSVIQNFGAGVTAGSLVKSGGGTLVLSRDNTTGNTYTGVTTLNAGTLQANTGASVSLTPGNPLGTSALQLNGGTLQLRSSGTAGSAADTIQWNNNTTVGGDVTINVTRAGGTGSNKIHQLGTLSIGAHTLTASDVSNENHDLRFGATTLTGNATFNVPQNSGSMNLTLGAVGESGGARSLTKTGAAALTITGNSNFSGGLVVNAGNLFLTSDQSFTGGVTLNGGSLGGNAAGQGIGATAIDSNAVTVNGSAAFLITANETLATNITINPTGTLDIGTSNGGTSTISGVVSGTGVLVPEANNVNTTTNLILSNTANTFTGDVRWTAQNGNKTLSVNSIGDGGKVVGGLFANAVTKTFALNSTASAALTFNTRQFELAGVQGASALAIANNSAQAFTINTDLLSSGTGTRTLTLNGTGTGLSTFAGKITNGNITNLGITKADGGVWSLTNTANSYTGVTTITAGTLQVSTLADGSNNSNIGASTNAAGNLVLNGGTLRYMGGAQNTDRLFSVGTTAGSAINSSGTGALNFNNTGAMGFNAQTGARTLTLTGTNTGNNTIAAAIGDNTGATAIAKTGIGTWVLSGTNSATGTTSISGGGTLVLNYVTNNNTKLGTGALTVTGGGNLILRGGSSFVQTVASTTLSAGGGNLSITQDTSGTNTINLNAITRGNANHGATLSLDVNSVATTDTLNNTGGILGGWVTVGSNWAKNSTSAADGAIVGLTAGEYTAMPLTGGTGTVNYQLTGAAALSGGVTGNSLRISNNADDQVLNLGLNRNIGLGLQGPTGGLLYAGGNNNNYTITGTGTSRLGAQQANQEFLINTFTGTLTVEVPILSAGSNTNGAFTKTGLGTLVLTAASDYQAATFVNQGVLRVRNNAALGALSSGVNSTFVFNGAALELDNNVAIGAEALTITGTGISDGGALRSVSTNTTSTSYAGLVTIGAGGARINTDGTAPLTLSGGVATSLFNNVTFGGAGNTTVQTAAISGAGGLIKDGAGTTTLTATNTYTGATIVAGGILAVNGSLANTTTTVQSGGTLQGSGTIGGSVTIQSGGTLASGNSIESLATGALSLEALSTFAYEMNRDAAANESGDLTAVTGNLTIALTNDANLSLFELGAGTWEVGEKLTLISYTGTWNGGLFKILGGSVINDDTTITYSNVNWLFNYDDTAKGDNYTADSNGTYVTMTAMAVIPEPGAALIGSLGLLALLRRRRN